MRFLAPAGTELVEPLPGGSVFQVARVREGGAVVVCKRLLPRVRSEPAGRAAIVREATALSRARHPALPDLLRVGSDAQGPFVLEAHAAGTSVRDLVAGWRNRHAGGHAGGRPGGGVPPRLVAHLALAAAEALAEVHELVGEGGPLGLSHGDLGPDHLLLGPLGEARFIDFGAARFAGMDPALETGDKGTLPFTPPEVARGEATPGPAADVYALAATLLFLAIGGAPLVAARDEGAMLLEVGERGLAPDLCDGAAGLSAAGKAALRQALALDPAGRITSARALAEALAR
jgi:eukaryotic-like serine/threonine-protein kinase